MFFASTSRHRTAGLLLSCLGALVGVRAAQANMAAKSFFTPGIGGGVLSAPGTASIRVREISLSLDFRISGRQLSTAEYLLANLDEAQAWEDSLVFVSTAANITVTIDGRPAQVAPQGRAFNHSPEIIRALGVGIQGHGFRVRLAPGQQTRIVVGFLCEPGKVEVNTRTEHQRDGLTRFEISHRSTVAVDHRFFSYPLWPAYGFAGGVSEMGIVVLTGPGVTPPERSPAGAWTAQSLPAGETRWTIRLPEARTVDQAPMRDVLVRYPAVPESAFRVGASVFAGARFAGKNERLASAHLALNADLIVAGLGAFSLGGETAFTQSASLSLGFQRGAVSSLVSGYLGGAALATLWPAPTPGFELRAGTRMVWLPLDVAFQVHPWVTPGQGHVARYRLIVGLRAGVW